MKPVHDSTIQPSSAITPRDGTAVPTHASTTASALRASDADRQRVVASLQQHFVAGRLTTDELGDRISRALAAQTFRELDTLVVDLPVIDAVPTTSPLTERGRAAVEIRPLRRPLGPFAGHVVSYLMVMAMLVTIWLVATPGAYFWPMWPMLGWGIGLARHAMGGSTCHSGRRRRRDRLASAGMS